MATKIDGIPWNLNRKINTAYEHIKQEAADKVAQDVVHMYNSVIKQFYQHYRPRSYDRTFTAFSANNMYGSDNYQQIISQHDDGFTVNFLVGDEFLDKTLGDKNPYRADRYWVFERTFTEGIHGWKPEEIEERYSSDAWIPSYDSGGHIKTDSILGLLQIAAPLSPPPKERMDTIHRKYKVASRLRKKLKPIVDKNMHKYLG